MKNTYFIIIICFIISSTSSLGQILTKNKQTKGFNLSTGMFNVEYIDAPQRLTIPSNDRIQKLLKDDSTGTSVGGYRIAEPIPTQLDVTQLAKWIVKNDTAYGRYSINLPGATTTSVIFDKFWIPKHCQLYIYNSSGTIAGPITELENRDDYRWGSPLFRGGTIWFEVKLPYREKAELKLLLSSAAYGYKEINSSVFGFGSSAPCVAANNVVCSPLGNGWEVQRNAVCMILRGDGAAICTGTLVNNTCNDNRPYVLTANHCALPESVGVWRFIFGYWSTTCNSQDDTDYLTFNGATFRANNNVSDFLLLELNNTPSGLFGTSELKYAGWDRSTSTPSNAVTLHHPSGDVMKIAKSNSVFSAVQTAIDNVPLVDNSHWGVSWATGATEGSSSGAALFNQNNRIVGQLHGGNAFCEPISGVDLFGKLDRSWSGNGTNGTRLSNWLDPSGGSATTTTAIGVHYLNGPDLICSSGNFSVINLPSGMSVSWSSNNTNGLAINSSGLATRVNNYNGPITVTATLTLSGCVNITKRKSIWVGTPVLTYMTYGITGTSPGSNVLSVNNVNPSPFFYWVRTNIISGTTSWTKTPSSINGYPGGAHEYIFSLTSGQQVDFVVNTTNSCGSSSRTTRFRAPTTLVAIYPNPAKDIITVDLSVDQPGTIELYSEKYTKPVRSVGFPASNGKDLSSHYKVNIEVGSLPRGRYFIHIVDNISQKTEKVQLLLD